MKARIIKKRDSSIKYFIWPQNSNLYKMIGNDLKTLQFLTGTQDRWCQSGCTLFELVPITEEQAKNHFPKTFNL